MTKVEKYTVTTKDAINKIDAILLQLKTNSERIKVIIFINSGYSSDGHIILRKLREVKNDKT